MSLAATITVRDTATPFLQRFGAALRSPALKRALGAGVADQLKTHFAGLQSARPNKQGWPRQGFWATAVRRVQQPKVNGDTVTVSINQPGLALRYFGGTVKPVTRQFLAIPARAEAYGLRPIDARWSGKLEFSLVGGRYPALVFRDNSLRVVSRGAKKGQRRLARKDETATTGAGEVVYWLARQTTHPADPSVLPTNDQMVNRAVEFGQNWIAAQKEKA